MTEIFTPDKLFVVGSAFPVVTQAITIEAGAGVLKRGTVLGMVTATRKYRPVNSTATDGSQEADCVLAEDVDATTADVNATAYFTGEFNESALIFGGTDTADTHRRTLRKIGIFLHKTVSV